MPGIFIKSIGKGSAADLDGRVKVNDQITEVYNKHFKMCVESQYDLQIFQNYCISF